MLMELFYNTLPENIIRKRRIHFHQFMISVHKRSHFFKSLHHRPSGMVMSATTEALTGAAGINVTAAGTAGHARENLSQSRRDADAGNDIDPIEPVAAEIANQMEVLCFDEFQVTDIADAMILRRLMEHLLAYGTVIVITSK